MRNALPLEDSRLAIRRLRKDAGATIASVAALACAIGAAVATWSLLSAVLLKPLPVEAPVLGTYVIAGVQLVSLRPALEATRHLTRSLREE